MFIWTTFKVLQAVSATQKCGWFWTIYFGLINMRFQI